MNNPSRVLVVDDDLTSRNFLQFALGKRGYAVTAAEDATEAQEQLTPANLETFDCIITDYRMPDHSGLELLAWIKERDPSLATILVTAEGEKRLVTESLRGGAIDFLDKPVDLNRLQTAVARAVERTQQQRRLALSETAVKELGRVQARMLGVEAALSSARVEVCFHPKHEAGGDYFTRFRPAPDQLFCLLTDVSGHDLQAAYISAYFQGVVRGMLERVAPVEEIFSTFNRLLLEEWNQVDAGGCRPAGIAASVAACAIVIDSAAQTATVLAHGVPAPVYWLPDGDAQVIGEIGGFPLGWFPDCSARGVVQPVPGGGSFCLWTDGLEDLAEKQGVSALSLAYALQVAQARKQKLACIDAATDDILVAVVNLSSSDRSAAGFRPLLCERYHGGQAGEIDGFQARWQRSLSLAVPELPEAPLRDMLLASREALLNALHHGCGGHAARTARFQVAFCPRRQICRVRVSDSGPGHHFDLVQHEKRAAAKLVEKHRGLMLIHHLAREVASERGGASLTLDFDWRQPAATEVITPTPHL